MAGAQDPVIPPWNIQPTIDYLVKNGRPCQINIFEKGGHMLPLEHPEEYCQLIRGFARDW